MREMNPQEVRDFVAHNRMGVLSLAEHGRAYGVPLYYGYDGRALYFHTHPGMKTDYIRATEEVCFTICRVVGLDDWASVQVFGQLDPMEGGVDRIVAENALMSVPLPPEWGESTFGEPSRSSQNSADYRLRPARMSGRYSQTPRGSIEEREIAFGGM